MRNNVWKRLAWVLLLLPLLSACAGKSSEQVTKDLWSGWEDADLLMQADYPDAVPILLVHGWDGDEFTWPNGKRLLAMEKRLGRDIYYFNYRTGALPNRYPPLEALEEHLERYLKSFPEVDVVAHSMGGLLVRQYLAHHASPNIRRLLMFSVPHYGTDAAGVLARLASVAATGNVQVQEIQPGSDFLWQLNMLGGSELEGIDVLNAYATGANSLNGDLVVSPQSAWLPWARNVTISGNHHTLPEGLDRFAFITEFLQTGSVSMPEATKPVQRNLWIRVLDEQGAAIKYSEASVKRRAGPHAHWRSGGVSLCCKQRSSMYDQNTTTVIADDVLSVEALLLIDRKGTSVNSLVVQVPESFPLPVTLIERHAPEATPPEPGAR